jgi:hypothetical protein
MFKSHEQRFADKFKVVGECWIWQRYINKWGYGVIGVGDKLYLVHRLMYEYRIGPIPPDLCVLHRCDTPACINPAHLFLGTHQDNTDDKYAKGRQVHLRGERIGTSKLTTAKVRRIKRLFGRLSDCEIARRFDVSDSLIWNIRHGISWRHV